MYKLCYSLLVNNIVSVLHCTLMRPIKQCSNYNSVNYKLDKWDGAKCQCWINFARSLQPVYECSQFKCHRYDNQSVIRRMDILKVTTNKVTVREADDVTGEEM